MTGGLYVFNDVVERFFNQADVVAFKIIGFENQRQPCQKQAAAQKNVFGDIKAAFVINRVDRLIDFIPAVTPLVDNDRHQQIRVPQGRAAGIDADEYLQYPVK